MSFKAILTVDDTDYNILKCSFNLKQEIDSTGRPSSVTRGGTITLTVESSDDTLLFDWMCDSYMKKDGIISFKKRDEDAKMKDLNFSEAYLTEYVEEFDHEGASNMTITFTISALGIKMGESEHFNEWAI